MKLYIKYMVSLRCKMKVKEELTKLGIKFASIDLGVVNIMEDIDEKLFDQLRKALLQSGLEILDDKRTILVERIKILIIEMVHYSDELPEVNYSEHV